MMSIFNNHMEYYIYIFYMIILDSNLQMDLLIPTHGRSLALAAQAIRWRVSETTGKPWLECSMQHTDLSLAGFLLGTNFQTHSNFGHPKSL